MRILFAIVEMSPLAKAGGLADVGGSLPKALTRLGSDVRVILPFHRLIDRTRVELEPLAMGVAVPTPWGNEPVDLWLTQISEVPVVLLENNRFFDRPAIHGGDEVQRWTFYVQATLAAADYLRWAPDLLHLHDWHPALIGTWLQGALGHPWSDLPLVYTIHNLAFRGDFDPIVVRRWRLPEQAFQPPAGVAQRSLYNSMAQGILHADVVSTVSETYAKEILTPDFGAGLDPLLKTREDRLYGILNGIDYEVFNPATDPHLAARFDVGHLDRRVTNKSVLQQFVGLPTNPSIPLAGVVARLYYQKGIDILVAAFERLLAEQPLQLVVLGTGDEAHEQLLAELATRFPDKVALIFRFDEPLAQLIYGGCDFFLMPSRYEPCGLGQMIAMRYGAVPIVRRTGGLADTVEDCTRSPSTGTGFVFEEATGQALRHAVMRAIAAFEDPERWRRIQQCVMCQDFSWNQTAGKYLTLYERASAHRRALSHTGSR